jgi:hypothetical protein
MGEPTSDRNNQPQQSDWNDADIRDWNVWCGLQHFVIWYDPPVQYPISVYLEQRIGLNGGAVIYRPENIYARDN